MFVAFLHSCTLYRFMSKDRSLTLHSKMSESFPGVLRWLHPFIHRTLASMWKIFPCWLEDPAIFPILFALLSGITAYVSGTFPGSSSLSFFPNSCIKYRTAIQVLEFFSCLQAHYCQADHRHRKIISWRIDYRLGSDLSNERCSHVTIGQRRINFVTATNYLCVGQAALLVKIATRRYRSASGGTSGNFKGLSLKSPDEKVCSPLETRLSQLAGFLTAECYLGNVFREDK